MHRQEIITNLIQALQLIQRRFQMANNQPAFPAPAGVSHITEQGMTLRDYFAAKAMQTFVEKYSHEGDVSRSAYKVADAMMKARNENNR